MSRTQGRMRDAVCFDTSALIWGIREESSRGQEYMIERTKRYIKFLDVNEVAIMVPTPVLSEYFVGATATEIHELNLIRRGYEHPGLDVPAAMLAAELQRGNTIQQIADQFGIGRQCIRTDALIVAIAITNGATKIVTDDIRHFKVLARGKIPVEEVPDITEQGSLFST